MSENADGFIDGLLNEIAERVIKRISENNSNWLNTIQYKVKAENIEGLIQLKQIEGLEDAINDSVADCRSDIEGWATNAAEEVINNATFQRQRQYIRRSNMQWVKDLKTGKHYRVPDQIAYEAIEFQWLHGCVPEFIYIDEPEEEST